MDNRTTLILIVALSCPGRSVAQSVRNYDDTGDPPFRVLKEAGVVTPTALAWTV